MAKKKTARRVRPSKEVLDILGSSRPKPLSGENIRKRPARKPTAADSTPDGEEGAIPEGHRMVNGVLVPPYPPELATIEDGAKSPKVKEWYQENHPEAYKVLFQRTLG